MGCPTTNRWEQEIFLIQRSAAYIERAKRCSWHSFLLLRDFDGGSSQSLFDLVPRVWYTEHQANLDKVKSGIDSIIQVV